MDARQQRGLVIEMGLTCKHLYAVRFVVERESKTDVAMKNEVLCKLIAHNLCVLIQEQHTLGIEPLFTKPETKAVAACNDLNSPAMEFVI